MQNYFKLIEIKWLVLFSILIFGFVLIFFSAQSVKTPKTAELSKKVESCLNLEMNLQLSCVNKELGNISKTYGVKPALNVIEPLSERHSYLLDWSHEFSHTIGGAAVADYKYADRSMELHIGQALTECDGYGAFGCYHGVIETGLSKLPVEKRASVIREACMRNPLIQDKQYYVNQCLHWFGHGVAVFSNLTLNEALEMCEELNDGFYSDEVQLCLSGIFHAGTVPGDSDDSLLHNVQNVWKKGDPYFPCLDIGMKFRGHCFSHSPGRIQSEDPKIILAVCDNIPETNRNKKLDYVWRCYESAANIILPNILRDINLDDDQKVEKIVSECRNFSRPEYRKFCYAGTARYWVLRDPLLSNLNPFKICKAVEKEAKSMCYADIGFGNNENYYSNDKLEEYCANSEPEFVKDCLLFNPTLYLFK